MSQVQDTSETKLQGGEVRRWIFWFAVLNVIDGLQTMAVVGRFGLGAEANPWIRWWLENYSMPGLWIAKLSLMLVALLFIHRMIRVLRCVSLGMSVIVALNFMTLYNLRMF